MVKEKDEVTKPLNVKEAAIYLGTTKSYLYQLMSRHEVAFYKHGVNGKAFFKVSDLNNYAYRNRVEANYVLEQKAEKILGGSNK